MQVPILIVGAGPAGLAVAGRLRKLDIPFTLIEKTDKIAWSWHNHYDRLCLHTVKQLSHLPHLPFPDAYPLYVPRTDLAKYYENYAKHFNIEPLFNQALKHIQRSKTGKWVASTEQGQVYETPHIVIATGINRVPFSPSWKGQTLFNGQIIHSRHYKNPLPFKGKRVLIIGMGNTGAELALDLAEHEVEVCISVRSPIAIVPRDVNGRPVQLTAKKLAKIPFGIGDWLGTQVRKVVIGDLSKYGLQMIKTPPAQLIRETGRTPVIDLGTVEYIKSGKIKILPDISHLYEEGIVLKDGQSEAFDSVILATGYKAKMDDFLADTNELLDQYDVPKQAVGAGKYEGLYFVGFDNYKLGGILGTIYKDSETVATTLQKRVNQVVAS